MTQRDTNVPTLYSFCILLFEVLHCVAWWASAPPLKENHRTSNNLARTLNPLLYFAGKLRYKKIGQLFKLQRPTFLSLMTSGCTNCKVEVVLSEIVALKWQTFNSPYLALKPPHPSDSRRPRQSSEEKQTPVSVYGRIPVSGLSLLVWPCFFGRAWKSERGLHSLQLQGLLLLTWINWIVRADFPTPPPPTTTRRYFSCTEPSFQPAIEDTAAAAAAETPVKQQTPTFPPVNWRGPRSWRHRNADTEASYVPKQSRLCSSPPFSFYLVVGM